MFEDKAKRFVDTIDSYKNRFDEGKFLSQLQIETYPFKRNVDKLSFLKNIESGIIEEKEEHEKVCTNPRDKCAKSKTYNKCLFFVKQEIDELSDLFDSPTNFPGSNESKPQDQTNFTQDEKLELNFKIDEVLFLLKKLGLGQELIYNEIEELKKDAGRVNRKDLGLMVVGKLVEYGSNELCKEPAVLDLYKYITDGLKNLPPFKT